MNERSQAVLNHLIGRKPEVSQPRNPDGTFAAAYTPEEVARAQGILAGGASGGYRQPPGPPAPVPSAADMLIFAKAVLDPVSAIAPAVKTTLAVRVPAVPPAFDQALGWQVMHLPHGRELLAHGGQSGGFQSYLILEPAKSRAVVVLANSEAQPAPTDIAPHILIGTPVEPTPPVPPAPPPWGMLIFVSAAGLAVCWLAVRWLVWRAAAVKSPCDLSLQELVFDRARSNCTAAWRLTTAS